MNTQNEPNGITIKEIKSEYTCIRKIEICYKVPTFFRKPKIERACFHSLSQFMLTTASALHLNEGNENKYFSSEDIWALFLKDLQDVLTMAYIPIWAWMLLFICTLGLCGWVVLPWQSKKTQKAADKLVQIVKKWNSAMMPIGNQLVQFEIPFPSKNGVLLHACFLEHK